jgi:hypothetical protein
LDLRGKKKKETRNNCLDIMGRFIIQNPHQILFRAMQSRGRDGRECSAHGRDESRIKKF